MLGKNRTDDAVHLNLLTEMKPEHLLHCIGGFIPNFFYGSPHATGDTDYFTAVTANRKPFPPGYLTRLRLLGESWTPGHRSKT
jgi:hypothetical protein